MALKAASGSVLILRGFRRTRMFDGKPELVGVAGRTLTEVCGLRPPSWTLVEPVGDARDAEADEVEDALDMLC